MCLSVHETKMTLSVVVVSQIVFVLGSNRVRMSAALPQEDYTWTRT